MRQRLSRSGSRSTAAIHRRSKSRSSPATGMLAAAMVAQLGTEFGASAGPLSNSELAARLARLGLEFGSGDEHARSELAAFHPRFYCVKGPDGAPGCCVGTPFRITDK